MEFVTTNLFFLLLVGSYVEVSVFEEGIRDYTTLVLLLSLNKL